jgi:hypothetical protein
MTVGAPSTRGANASLEAVKTLYPTELDAQSDARFAIEQILESTTAHIAGANRADLC